MDAARVRALFAAVLLALALAALTRGGHAEASHVPYGVYTGQTSNGGTITLWVDSAGTAVRGLLVALPPSSNCSGIRFGGIPGGTVSGESFTTVSPGVGAMTNIAFNGTFSASGDGTVSGSLSWTGSGTDCVSGQTTWTASRSSTIGIVQSGQLPTTEGFGLIVFGGGYNGHLANAVAIRGCPSTTAVFWVTDEAGNFVQYIPGAQVQAVNEAWNAKFRNNIPTGTPIIVKCR